jgi:hypothetical protein
MNAINSLCAPNLADNNAAITNQFAMLASNVYGRSDFKRCSENSHFLNKVATIKLIHCSTTLLTTSWVNHPSTFNSFGALKVTKMRIVHLLKLRFTRYLANMITRQEPTGNSKTTHSATAVDIRRRINTHNLNKYLLLFS